MSRKLMSIFIRNSSIIFLSTTADIKNLIKEEPGGSQI